MRREWSRPALCSADFDDENVLQMVFLGEF
jgi:hypothetical protein